MRVLAEITRNEPLGGGVYRMALRAPEAARQAKPGQFVHIGIPDGEKILRRPISICDVWEDEIVIAYAVRGGGTKTLSDLPIGERVDMLAPLGKGFELEGYHNIAVVGGGIGIFPLLYAIKCSDARSKTAFLGFRSEREAVLLDTFSALSELHIATEDGSIGDRGYVTDALAKHWRDYDAVLACGPMPMLKAVNRLCLEKGVDPQVSVEERMGCGLGGCLVCACRIKKGNESDYAHVCIDGPVFLGSVMDWEVD